MSTVDILAPKGSSPMDRHAAHIAVATGISCNAAALLMLMPADDLDTRSLDESGLDSLLWLVCRGFASLEDRMGILYVRPTPAGCRAVINGRHALERERRYAPDSKIDPRDNVFDPIWSGR